jgi:hypothetical protein
MTLAEAEKSKRPDETYMDLIRRLGYDGLCNDDADCGCGVDDLVPCWEDPSECELAYHHDVIDGLCADGDCGHCGRSGDFSLYGYDDVFCLMPRVGKGESA